MSCSGYFEPLLRQVEQQSFRKNVLKEIQEVKDRYQRKLRSLQVQGDFHNATQVKAKLEKLEKITERMKQFLEVQRMLDFMFWIALGYLVFAA